MLLTKSRGKDLTGQTFGRLTVIKQAEKKGKNPRWICKCKCGNEKEFLGYNLKSGHSKSCGCLSVEVAIESNTTHGMRKTRFYQIFRDMHDRTSRKKNVAFSHYGGRGIRVCEEWKTFEGFMNDMYESYLQHSQVHGEINTTIDRMNNNGNYTKSNCRWATPTIQSSNRRSNRRYSDKGEILTITELARKYNLPRGTVNKRVKLGWTGDALVSPTDRGV